MAINYNRERGIGPPDAYRIQQRGCTSPPPLSGSLELRGHFESLPISVATYPSHPILYRTSGFAGTFALDRHLWEHWSQACSRNTRMSTAYYQELKTTYHKDYEISLQIQGC